MLLQVWFGNKLKPTGESYLLTWVTEGDVVFQGLSEGIAQCLNAKYMSGLGLILGHIPTVILTV